MQVTTKEPCSVLKEIASVQNYSFGKLIKIQLGKIYHAILIVILALSTPCS